MRKLIAILLAIVMVVGSFPFAIAAEENYAEDVSVDLWIESAEQDYVSHDGIDDYTPNYEYVILDDATHDGYVYDEADVYADGYAEDVSADESADQDYVSDEAEADYTPNYEYAVLDGAAYVGYAYNYDEADVFAEGYADSEQELSVEEPQTEEPSAEELFPPVAPTVPEVLPIVPPTVDVPSYGPEQPSDEDNLDADDVDDLDLPEGGYIGIAPLNLINDAWIQLQILNPISGQYNPPPTAWVETDFDNWPTMIPDFASIAELPFHANIDWTYWRVAFWTLGARISPGPGQADTHYVTQETIRTGPIQYKFPDYVYENFYRLFWGSTPIFRAYLEPIPLMYIPVEKVWECDCEEEHEPVEVHLLRRLAGQDESYNELHEVKFLGPYENWEHAFINLPQYYTTLQPLYSHRIIWTVYEANPPAGYEPEVVANDPNNPEEGYRIINSPIQILLPELNISKTATPEYGNTAETAGEVRRANQINYRITVSNSGEAPAFYVVVEDEIPAHLIINQPGIRGQFGEDGPLLTIDELEAQGVIVEVYGQLVKWTIESLAYESTFTLHIPTTVSLNAPNGTIFRNQALITEVDGDATDYENAENYRSEIIYHEVYVPTIQNGGGNGGGNGGDDPGDPPPNVPDVPEVPNEPQDPQDPEDTEDPQQPSSELEPWTPPYDPQLPDIPHPPGDPNDYVWLDGEWVPLAYLDSAEDDEYVELYDAVPTGATAGTPTRRVNPQTGDESSVMTLILLIIGAFTFLGAFLVLVMYERNSKGAKKRKAC